MLERAFIAGELFAMSNGACVLFKRNFEYLKMRPKSKGRTIRKVMGWGGGGCGVGKKPKKNSCKGKCQEKKFMQRRR